MRLKQWYNFPKTIDPLDDLNRWRTLFGTLSEPARNMFELPNAGVFPLLNITAHTDHYTIRAELPGIKADELDITVSGNNVTIKGERKIPHEHGSVKYHRREREAGTFNRALTLPGPLDSGGVDAKLKNGLLTIVIPKAEEAKPKKINIH